MRERLLLDTAIAKAAYDERTNVWLLSTTDGREFSARYVVSAAGGPGPAEVRDIAGVNDFAGIMPSPAVCDQDVARVVKRGAVNDTRDTAVDLIHGVAARAKNSTVFDWTTIRARRMKDSDIGPVWRTILQHLVRTVVRHTGNSISDPAMNSQLAERQWIAHLITTTAGAGVHRRIRRKTGERVVGKIPALPDGFGHTLTRANESPRVIDREDGSLVAEPIEGDTHDGRRTADGVDRAADVLIGTTGLPAQEDTTPPNFPVFGCDGKELGLFWEAHQFPAYQGISVPHFPNPFIVDGPRALLPQTPPRLSLSTRPPRE